MFCCFNRKTAYEIRISDWSSDVCSSDLAENIPSGDPFDPAVASGPVVNQAAVDRILGMIDRAKSEGATLLAGGNRVDREGYYIEPTVFTDVDPDSELAQNEVFGPVLAIFKFSTEEERSDEHTSELQSLMRISYAVFCLKTKNT